MVQYAENDRLQHLFEFFTQETFKKTKPTANHTYIHTVNSSASLGVGGFAHVETGLALWFDGNKRTILTD